MNQKKNKNIQPPAGARIKGTWVLDILVFNISHTIEQNI